MRVRPHGHAPLRSVSTSSEAWPCGLPCCGSTPGARTATAAHRHAGWRVYTRTRSGREPALCVVLPSHSSCVLLGSRRSPARGYSACASDRAPHSTVGGLGAAQCGWRSAETSRSRPRLIALDHPSDAGGAGRPRHAAGDAPRRGAATEGAPRAVRPLPKHRPWLLSAHAAPVRLSGCPAACQGQRLCPAPVRAPWRWRLLSRRRRSLR